MTNIQNRSLSKVPLKVLHDRAVSMDLDTAIAVAAAVLLGFIAIITEAHGARLRAGGMAQSHEAHVERPTPPFGD
jgi:hypothetical protein